MRHALALMTVMIAGCDSCACGGGGAGDDDAPIPCGEAPGEHGGEATYYAADGSGNCSFDPTPGDLMVAALNTADYDGAAACGACAAVDGPDGSVTVRIVDRCPGCATGDIDLSQQAFERIAPRAVGRIPVSWRFVPCEVDGPLRYRFKEGSSAFWVGIQVRNHRHGVARLEAERDGAWTEIPRETYNYFVQSGGLGAGPVTLRVTDVYGFAVEDTVAIGDAVERPGASQLPACALR
jgi:expansin (peptidoglycan-binding protein)